MIKNQMELELYNHQYKETNMDKMKIFDKMYNTFTAIFHLIDMILNDDEYGSDCDSEF